MTVFISYVAAYVAAKEKKNEKITVETQDSPKHGKNGEITVKNETSVFPNLGQQETAPQGEFGLAVSHVALTFFSPFLEPTFLL